MSHRRTVIEPAAGLTVLVGPNNVGKSAIVAALQILCHNENSTYVKRHGAKDCAVIVHTSEGHVIEWRRKSSPSYVINGRRFDRLGNAGVPPELHQLLRLPLVAEDDDDSFNVHFGSQKSPIFLLNSKAGTAARFFASSSDAIRLLEMQQRHKEQVADAKREHKQLETESVGLRAELEVLEAIVPAAEQLQELESRFEQLGQVKQSISELTKCRADIGERAGSVELHEARSDALAPLQSPPVLAAPEPLEAAVNSLFKIALRTSSLSARSAALSDLHAPPFLGDEASLDLVSTQIHDCARRIARLMTQQQSLQTLAAPPRLEDTLALETYGGQLSRTQRDVARSAARCEQLAKLAAAPTLQDENVFGHFLERLGTQQGTVNAVHRSAVILERLAPPPIAMDTSRLEDMTTQFEIAARRIVEAQAAFAVAQEELREAEAALRASAEGQSCPTCGQRFDPEALVAMVAGAGGHAHD